MLPDPIKKFVNNFAKLPGIGPRQATRLAYYIANQGQNSVADFAKTVADLASIKTCGQCFASYHNPNNANKYPNVANGSDNCDICSNPQRSKKLIAIVEKETDLVSLEKTGKFPGRYLILGDLKKDGVLNEVQKLRLKTIKDADEVILAISPTTYGDINASIIAQELKNSAKKITRLGRGIPTGGEIEFADEETLGSALDNRN
jgi:recombination protein RecR